MTPKTAQLVADCVSVLCPACGEPQPSPDDGSDKWMRGDFARTTIKACVSCDVPLRIVPFSNVQFGGSK